MAKKSAKQKEKKTWKRFYKMIKPYKKSIIVIIIISLLIDIFELIKPYLTKIILDDYLPNKIYIANNISITTIVLAYIVLIFIIGALDYINRLKIGLIGENIVFNLRNKLFNHIEKSKIQFHDKTPAGKLFVRVANDTEDVYALFSEVVTTLPKDIMIIIGLLVMMVIIGKELFVINIIILPIIILTTLFFTNLLGKVYEKAKQTRTVINTFLAESIYGVKLIKLFNRQKEKKQEHEKYIDDHNKVVKPIGALFGLMPGLVEFAQNVGISLVVVFCLNKWISVELDIGVIYLFITYFKKIFKPISRIIENNDIVQDAFSSIDKIYEIIEEDTLEDYESGKIIEKFEGKIEFKNVWFAYEKEKWVLKNVSFTINPGESIALVGKTGSGKTTITNLINRFYTIQKGEILIDGINIYDINLKCLRKNIGTILQDPFIFAKTIRENIKMYSNASEKKIKEAVELASATNFVESLNNGLNEVAIERGNSYSAGQKQLIAFSRIFAQNPSIFILDEATANIDTTTEELIQKSVDKISAEKTSIFIAHRLSTIVNVDKIIVLDHGTIIEQGNHNELVQSGGYYSKLYDAYYHSLK